MCTLLFAYKVHTEYDFIFLCNRDEFKNRPTKPSHFWSKHSNVLAGIDLLKGGTWTGITKEGSMAFITNYRDFNIKISSTVSRGYLVKDFLTGNEDALSYLETIRLNKSLYDPFNLIVGSINNLYYYSNIEDKIKKLKPGIYGLSNALLDTPWPKVVKAKKRLSEVIDNTFSVAQLFEMLGDTVVADDSLLPNTGASIEIERMLSSIHIDTPQYGTRIKTIILINKMSNVNYHEKALDANGEWKSSQYKFKLILAK